MIHYCEQCDYKSAHKWSVRRHMQAKHKLIARKNVNDHSAPSQTGSGTVAPMEQTGPSHSPNEKHSNLQEESVDQLYENIDQWQKAYDTLKEQYQQVEKVTTCKDGRPSHVSIQLYDKCCKALNDYIYLCQGLRTQCQRVNTEKEQQLDRFCTAWEDLKWERDSFAKEINRRDCCGEGYLDKKMAKKVRSGKYWGPE